MGTVDSKLDKFVSKKFLAWIVATVFLGLTWCTNEQWYFITLAYLGLQGGIDALTKGKKDGGIK